MVDRGIVGILSHGYAQDAGRDRCGLKVAIRVSALRGSSCCFVVLLAAAFCAGCGERVIPAPAPDPWVTSLTLVDQSDNLKLDQGYASGLLPDGTPLNFFFDTAALYRSSSYDSLDVVASNRNFLPPGATHMGAGDYYDGHVYAVVEHWHGCKASSAPIYVAVFDATTLAEEQTAEIDPWIPEASGIAIDPDDGEAIVSSFCDPNNLYVFDPSTWAFTRTIPLQIPVTGNQGVSYRDGFIYIAGTNGGLYALRLSDNSMRQLLQSPVSGEFEGLDFHSSQLRWLVNRTDGQHILYSYAPTWGS